MMQMNAVMQPTNQTLIKRLGGNCELKVNTNIHGNYLYQFSIMHAALDEHNDTATAKNARQQI